jgi:prepilin-type N-terminal cleavage/methylation domain-containing protein
MPISISRCNMVQAKNEQGDIEMLTKTKRFFGGFSGVMDGFSMVELVIVVVIVGLSSAIAFPIVSINDTNSENE